LNEKQVRGVMLPDEKRGR